MDYDKKILADFNSSRSLEWLETNGLGGYASGTVSGAHSRRYHGLLVAATHPPAGRMNLLSKLDETIVMGQERYELGTNQYPGAVHPQGFQFLKKFQRDLFPEFHFEAGNVEIKKTIAALHGENTTLILYEVVKAPVAFGFELLPLYACRDFHGLSRANSFIGQQYILDDGILRYLNYQGCPEVFVSVPNSNFVESKGWYYNFEYAVEQYRGLDYQEDLYTHGKFVVALKEGDKLGIIISTIDPANRDAFQLFETERRRRIDITRKFSWNENLKRLSLAADQFIVKRGEHSTIIAGYHWFADWGRDTMISLPGLCLVTGRFAEAKQILMQFAESVSEGMLPNRFPDYGENPEYNTIDATLWFFNAVYHYYKYTNDKEFIEQLLPVLKEIIDWHYKGTRFGIKVDPADELLLGGADGVQLTWMDAKVGDWVVTPRKGKPVEVNALWHNALSTLGLLLVEAGRPGESQLYRTRAGKVLESFNALFWNENKNSLYDYVDGSLKNDDLRPNQIYAISLPFPLLTKDRAKTIFEKITTNLLTPKGLRSLASTHKDYRPVYGGGVWSRDGGYHQGTVWSFLIGPYIDALLYIAGKEGKKEATAILNKFFTHLNDGGVGTVSEILDAEFPHAPRGCIAQAWGVGEVLRVAVEYNLFANQGNSKKIPALANSSF
jgi:predicted glycogen debranching enzyme